MEGGHRSNAINNTIFSKHAKEIVDYICMNCYYSSNKLAVYISAVSEQGGIMASDRRTTGGFKTEVHSYWEIYPRISLKRRLRAVPVFRQHSRLNDPMKSRKGEHPCLMKRYFPA